MIEFLLGVGVASLFWITLGVSINTWFHFNVCHKYLAQPRGIMPPRKRGPATIQITNTRTRKPPKDKGEKE